MPFVVKDRVKVTSTTTGTGTFTLGAAVAGFQDFSSIGNANQTYYCITNGTDWEVGIGTYTSSGTTLSRDTVLESSNSNNKVDWAAGIKDVFCTFPSDATEGTVPTADDSSVGTDLYAWTNLKKQLDAGVINGVPYNNNNTAGMVSTYSLLQTFNVNSGVGGNAGGVLAPNGDIWFLPRSIPPGEGVIGQKISSTGVVSSYTVPEGVSLWGGVLTGNGDIIACPFNSLGGLRITASGVVSTFTVISGSEGAASYNGAVLAPNGDVHFIPYSSRRGMKRSAAGVVSTYSLVYTTLAAYSGGVLAPNGDIHFVPHESAVGQKISAAGVVSTYALVFSSNNAAYSGGVLSPNGDIHFIKRNAPVGQKVSISGVVSTYSLVFTSGSYNGGVLAPNGDIHFVPNTANLGQKISATGVVSTYSLVYTLGAGNNQYIGGVLDFNGNIHFIAYQAAVGQRISTNTTRPIGYNLSPFFNKF
jgi:streptogramin lyase